MDYNLKSGKLVFFLADKGSDAAFRSRSWSKMLSAYKKRKIQMIEKNLDKISKAGSSMPWNDVLGSAGLGR